MKTMLDKCAVAGDITQAIDRRGAWSCAVTVIGGTENTAVKLQSADSADGEFTDFKTLISADDAEADQYKGFVLDLSGAGNFIKIVGATMATCVLGDCDADVKNVAIKAGEIPSGADLENNKTATIDVSTYTEPVEVTPTVGKDGMKKATITLSNIPAIEDNKTATIDVSAYTEPVEIEPTEGKNGMKKATVTLSNIPSGGSVTAYCWLTNNVKYFFDFDTCPEDFDFSTHKTLDNNRVYNYGSSPYFDNATRVSDLSFTTSSIEGDRTYVRNSTYDFTLWQKSS